MRLAGIEGGIECARLAPLLSALADGEADAKALALLRPHLKTCLSCRARLREFRAVPGRVAALVPGGLAASGADRGGWVESAVEALQQKAEGLLAATQHKAAALGDRAQTAAELVTGQKVAALAVAAAAQPPRPAAAATAGRADRGASCREHARAIPRSSAGGYRAAGDHRAGRSARARSAPPTPTPPPDPANEFEAGAAAEAPAEAMTATAAPAQANPAPSVSRSSGEFAP